MGDSPTHSNSDSLIVKTGHTLIYNNEHIVIIQCMLIKFQWNKKQVIYIRTNP
jgi:hypothetical protein